MRIAGPRARTSHQPRLHSDLRLLLALADVDQAWLAGALGVSQPHVSMMLTGRRRFPAERRRRLVEALAERIVTRVTDDQAAAA